MAWHKIKGALGQKALLEGRDMSSLAEPLSQSRYDETTKLGKRSYRFVRNETTSVYDTGRGKVYGAKEQRGRITHTGSTIIISVLTVSVNTGRFSNRRDMFVSPKTTEIR